MNTAQLELSNATLRYESSLLTEEQLTPCFDTDNERVTFTPKSPLTTGTKFQLTVSFSAPFTNGMMGYYCSKWQKDGETAYYTLTQFQVGWKFEQGDLADLSSLQPTSARHAFPCFDEPLFKATFAINMISRANTVNLSNMPVASEEVFEPSVSFGRSQWLSDKMEKLALDADKWKITHFQTTPKVCPVSQANLIFTYNDT